MLSSIYVRLQSSLNSLNNYKRKSTAPPQTIPEIDDAVLRTVLESHSDLLTAAPFTHESLLIENKVKCLHLKCHHLKFLLLFLGLQFHDRKILYKNVRYLRRL